MLAWEAAASVSGAWFRACWLSHCHPAMTYQGIWKRVETSLMLLVTPVLFPPRPSESDCGETENEGGILSVCIANGWVFITVKLSNAFWEMLCRAECSWCHSMPAIIHQNNCGLGFQQKQMSNSDFTLLNEAERHGSYQTLHINSHEIHTYKILHYAVKSCCRKHTLTTVFTLVQRQTSCFVFLPRALTHQV